MLPEKISYKIFLIFLDGKLHNIQLSSFYFFPDTMKTEILMGEINSLRDSRDH